MPRWAHVEDAEQEPNSRGRQPEITTFGKLISPGDQSDKSETSVTICHDAQSGSSMSEGQATSPIPITMGTLFDAATAIGAKRIRLSGKRVYISNKEDGDWILFEYGESAHGTANHADKKTPEETSKKASVIYLTCLFS